MASSAFTPSKVPSSASITYWIITPEIDTDAVVHAVRNSWMLGAGADARFAVASGLSKSSDPTLHWLRGLNRSRLSVGIAASRAALNERLFQTVAPSLQNQTAHGYLLEGRPEGANSPPTPSGAEKRIKALADKAWRMTRKYNSFLRHKVFEILREICRAMQQHAFGYAFIMDADTAVNRSNLEAFVQPLRPAEAIYTGFCKRRWSAPPVGLTASQWLAAPGQALAAAIGAAAVPCGPWRPPPL